MILDEKSKNRLFCQKSCIVAYNSTKSYIGDSKSYIIFIKRGNSLVSDENQERIDPNLLEFD